MKTRELSVKEMQAINGGTMMMDWGTIPWIWPEQAPGYTAGNGDAENQMYAPTAAPEMSGDNRGSSDMTASQGMMY